jgi:4-methylaminobutanoate oxidase (formaldehyde-forming)
VPLCRGVNGLESFTPDGEFLGAPAGGEGLWLACGFCAHGISGSGGVGRALADWIVDGDPGADLSALDPRRFGTTPPDTRACRERACEIYRTYYDLRPLEQHRSN